MNQWLKISAHDYDGHMGPDYADQLGPLSAIFADAYRTTRPARMALLGCATGNGLEYVDPVITKRVVAIDVHPDFVALTKERYGRAIGPALEVRCEDLASCVLPSGAFDLVHAALIFEHVDHRTLVPRIANSVAVGGICAVVLQVEDFSTTGTSPITPSPFASIANLRDTMHSVSPGEIAAAFERQGMRPTRGWSVSLKGGKRFHVCEYARSL
ncbi:MAG: class I SAM-dependent methyltransferase [Polyangiaceae bacterium]|jgi:SAM-dependent methyltransferase